MPFRLEAIDPSLGGFFIRHQNFEGRLTQLDNSLQDFEFELEIRDPFQHEMVSFSAVNPHRGKYFRHRVFKIVLEEFPPESGDHGALFLFLRDSTFFMEPGLADGNASSFRSFNFPDHFLRHREFRLVVEPNDNSPLFAADATFRVQEI